MVMLGLVRFPSSLPRPRPNPPSQMADGWRRRGQMPGTAPAIGMRLWKKEQRSKVGDEEEGDEEDVVIFARKDYALLFQSNKGSRSNTRKGFVSFIRIVTVRQSVSQLVIKKRELSEHEVKEGVEQSIGPSGPSPRDSSAAAAITNRMILVRSSYRHERRRNLGTGGTRENEREFRSTRGRQHLIMSMSGALEMNWKEGCMI
jgi:DNA gyrase/topoisomerase IV subunit A